MAVIRQDDQIDGLNTRESTMLGQGVYTVAEVSKLTDLNPTRVRSWFKQRSDRSGRGPVFESDYQSVGGDYAVSFLDLVDVLVAGTLRDRFNVPMRVVRRAHGVLEAQLGTKHAFCHNDLYTDGKKIFLYAANEVHEEILREIVSRQQFFLYIKEKLDHIDYNEISKLARRWRIAEGVVIDPAICMGKPTVAKTGIATYVVANQYYANHKDSGLVADLYGISEKDVANAVTFENRYRHRDAA
jgi:uncharacterized protein (DUF433 family)